MHVHVRTYTPVQTLMEMHACYGVQCTHCSAKQTLVSVAETNLGQDSSEGQTFAHFVAR